MGFRCVFTRKHIWPVFQLFLHWVVLLVIKVFWPKSLWSCVISVTMPESPRLPGAPVIRQLNCWQNLLWIALWQFLKAGSTFEGAWGICKTSFHGGRHPQSRWKAQFLSFQWHWRWSGYGCLCGQSDYTLGANSMPRVADILVVNIRWYKGELNSALRAEENTCLVVQRPEERNWFWCAILPGWVERESSHMTHNFTHLLLTRSPSNITVQNSLLNGREIPPLAWMASAI